MNPKVSIIIPTLHRRTSLLRLLATIPRSPAYEVIIVEQGDNNKKYFKNVRYYFLSDHNTAKAKNVGASHARGGYIIFYDDDVVVHKRAIQQLIKNFANPMIGAVGGRVITPGQQIEPDRRDIGRVTPWGVFSDGFSSTIRQDIQTLIGCHMAFRKDIFTKLGGFDERYTGAIREDSDLSLRVLHAGYRVVFEPDAVVTHMREPSGGGRKTEGRLDWYFNFFSNETYFFLKHCSHIYFPIFVYLHAHWALRCMFGFGREVSKRSILTPILGIIDGYKKYYDYRR